MEINTEINKIFGTEMAKIFASSISEEELMQKAKECWNNLITNEKYWGSRSDSQIEKYIKEVLLERLHEKILTILKEPVNDQYLEEHARELVAKAKEIADEAIIKSMAEKLVTNTLSAYNVHDKFIDDVYRILHTGSN